MLVTWLPAGPAADAFEVFVQAEAQSQQDATIATCLDLWREARRSLRSLMAPPLHGA